MSSPPNFMRKLMLRLEVVEVVVIVNALFDLRAELLAGAGDKVKRVVKDFINLINFTLFP